MVKKKKTETLREWRNKRGDHAEEFCDSETSHPFCMGLRFLTVFPKQLHCLPGKQSRSLETFLCIYISIFLAFTEHSEECIIVYFPPIRQREGNGQKKTFFPAVRLLAGGQSSPGCQGPPCGRLYEQTPPESPAEGLSGEVSQTQASVSEWCNSETMKEIWFLIKLVIQHEGLHHIRFFKEECRSTRFAKR